MTSRPATPRLCRHCLTPITGPCTSCTPTRIKRHNQSTTYYRSTEWQQLRQQTLDRDHHQCIIIGCASTHRLTAHHIHPRKEGGPDALHNLTTLCHACHQAVEAADQSMIQRMHQALRASARARGGR